MQRASTFTGGRLSDQCPTELEALRQEIQMSLVGMGRQLDQLERSRLAGAPKRAVVLYADQEMERRIAAFMGRAGYTNRAAALRVLTTYALNQLNISLGAAP